ncbi:MAG: DUF2341 domain-containing protein [Candidatus Omnitrophica bacterium]|nr:DUF2341 domain-containing protein [Candidatus Omnitrophota bacterium]
MGFLYLNGVRLAEMADHRRILQIPVFVLAIVIAFATSLYALPKVDEVVSGKAEVNVSDNTMRIDAADNTIINYSTFDIAENESVIVSLPKVDSKVLNRVLGSSRSEIMGRLECNGIFILVNKSGVYVGPNANVDVQSLVLSTRDITDSDFLSGKHVFKKLTKEEVDGLLLNEGKINIREGGFGVLIAGAIENRGKIIAPAGKIVLAAGDAIKLDIAGNGLISVAILEKTASNILDHQGNPITDQIKNTGELEAGTVVLKAEHVTDVFRNAINLEGCVSANRIEKKDGVVRITASGNVNVATEIEASAVEVKSEQDVNILADIKAYGGDIDLFADSDGDGKGSFTQVVGIIEATGKGDIYIDGSGEMSLKTLISELGAIKIGARRMPDSITGSPEYIHSKGDMRINKVERGENITSLHTERGDKLLYASSGEVKLKAREGSIVQIDPVPLPGKNIELEAGHFDINTGALTTLVHDNDSDIYIDKIIEILEDAVAIEGSGFGKVTYIKTHNITIKTNRDMDTAPGVLIPANQAKIVARRIGTPDNPVGISANLTYIHRIQGDINVSEIWGLGSTIFIRGPDPHTTLDSWGAVGYKKGSDLVLEAENVRLTGDEPVHLHGNITFHNFECLIPDKEIYFHPGKTYTFKGDLRIIGAPDQGPEEFYIKLRSHEKGSAWFLDVKSENYTLDKVNGSDCHALDTVIIPDGVNAGNNVNLDIDPVWDGGHPVHNDWSRNQNWSGNALPTGTDEVRFNGTSGDDCIIDNVGSWSGGDFIIEAGYTGTITQNTGVSITANNFQQAGGTFVGGSGATNVTVNGNFSQSGGSFTAPAGSLNISGNFSRTGGTFAHNSGTAVFNGSAAQAITGTNTWYNLTINNTASSPGDSIDVDPNAAQTVINNLSVTDGQWSPSTGDTYNNVSIGTNGIMKPDPGANISVSGNWTHTGTWSANSGTVTFNGAGTSQLTGSTVFYNFTCTTEGKTLEFMQGDIFTFNGTLTLTGVSGNEIVLNSQDGSTRFTFSVASEQTVDYVDVSNSDVDDGGSNIIAQNSIDNTNNDTGPVGSYWIFANPINLSGLVYTDRGVTLIGPGSEIVLVIDGSVIGSDDTDGSSRYEFTGLILQGTEIALVYINDNAVNGASVTLPGDLDITDLDIYGDSVIVRHERTGPVSNADLATAKGALSDIDIVYSVTGNDLLLDSGVSLVLRDGDIFTPGGDIDSTDLLIGAGSALNAASGSTITLTGDWINSGAFNPGTSVVSLTGSGSRSVTSNGSAFNDLTLTGTGTYGLLDPLEVDGDLNISSGGLDASGETITVGGDWDNSGTFTHNGNTVIFDGSGTGSITGDTVFSGLSCTAAGKTLKFKEGDTFTVEGTFALTGASGNEIVLESQDGVTRFTLKVLSEQTVNFTDISDLEVDDTGENIIALNSINGGNNDDGYTGAVVVFGARAKLEGYVYSDRGITLVGSGTNVVLVIEGTELANTDTGGDSRYKFSNLSVSSGDAILVYIDDATVEGNTVTSAISANMSGVDIYGDTLTVRHENAGPASNVLLSSAKGALADTEILYTVTGPDLSVNTGTDLLVWQSDSFTPAGEVSADNIFIQNAAVLDIEGNDLSASGSLDNEGIFRLTGGQTITGLTMDTDSGLVEYTGNGVYSGLAAGDSYYDLTFSGYGVWALDNDLDINGDLLLEAGGVWPNGYSYRKLVVIDSSLVAGNLADFAVLLSFIDPELATTANGGNVTSANGFDIILTDSNNNQLDHEIESYDPVTGQVIFWTRAPSLSGSTDTTFFLYYGNSAVTTSQENVNGVWDSDFQGVWHMDETSGTMADSTSNGTDGTPRNGLDQTAAGKIGGGSLFAGGNDYVALDNFFYTGTGYPAVTFSAWINTADGGNQIIGSYDRNEFWRLEVNGRAGTGEIGWDVMTEAGQQDFGSNSRVDDGTWHHVSGVYDNGDVIIYIDGSVDNSTTRGSTLGRGKTRYGYLGVGSESSSFDANKGPTNYFNGSMDEARLSNSARTPQWIETEFNNQDDPGSFHSVSATGAEASATLDTGTYNVSVAEDLTAEGDNIIGSGTFVFDGTAPSDITGGITFHNLSSTTPGKTLRFKEGEKFTVNGALTLTGSVSQDVVLDSQDGVSQFIIKVDSPQTVDYVSVSNSDVDDAGSSITANNSAPGANVDIGPTGSYWIYPGLSFINVSGDVYSDLGSTLIGSGVNIVILVNGTDRGNTDTNGSSRYTFTNIPVFADQGLMVYINNNAVDGNTVTMPEDSDIVDLDIWGGAVMVRHEDAGPISNVELASAIGSLSDVDILYSASGNDVTVVSGPDFIVRQNYTYAPGGDLTCEDILIQSGAVLNGASGGFINISGDMVNGGTYNAITSTVVFNGTGQQNLTSGGAQFYGLRVTNTSSAGLVLADDLSISGPIEVYTDGVLDLSDKNVTSTGSVVSNEGRIKLDGGQTITGLTMDSDSGEVRYVGNGTYTGLAAGNAYYDLTFAGGGEFTLNADLDVNGDLIFATSVPWPNGYSYRRLVTIDSSYIDADLEDFPFLFSLTDSELANILNGGHLTEDSGYDLIFTDLAGAQYDHQIEYYDNTSGKIIAWVKIPTVTSASDTTFYLYYGNSSITTSQENINGVWDGKYEGIWHLDETSGSVLDSTSNGNNGTPDFTFPGLQDYQGIVDGAVFCDNNDDDFIVIPDDNSIGNNGMSALTFSMWIYPEDNTDFYDLGGTSDGWNGDGYNLYLRGGNPGEEYAFTINTRFGGLDYIRAGSIVTGEWHHLAGTYDGGTMRLYLDGAEIGNNTAPAGDTTNNGSDLYIGVIDLEPDYSFGGIDEVRIAQEAMSPEWIAAEYDNVKTPSAFSSAGSEETPIGVLHTVNYNVNVAGDLVNSGDGLDGNSNFIFDGTAKQEITPGSFTFYDLNIVNQSSDGVQMMDDLIVTNIFNIETDGVLDVKGFNITATGASFSNDGTLKLHGGQTVTGLVMDTDSGTIEYTGDNYYTGLLLGDDYFNLSFSGVGVYILDADLNVAGDLSLKGTAGIPWPNGYYYRKLITINSSQVNETLVNYPVLFSVTDPSLATVANGGEVTSSTGDDIVFTDQNGNSLDHEIEAYDPSTGNVIAWIRVPNLSDAEDTMIFMYYKNSSVTTPQEDPAGTWGGAYIGVWHLDEKSGTVVDSSAFFNDGTENISPNSNMDAAGIIDGADNFDGTDDYIDFGTLFNQNTGTVSFWMKPDSTFGTSSAETQGIVGMYVDGNDNFSIALRGADYASGDGTTGNIQVKMEESGAQYISSTTNTWNAGQWYHVGVAWGNAETYVFVDGAQENSVAANQDFSGQAAFEIGRTTFDTFNVSGDQTRYLDGTLDEVRFSTTRKTEGWMSTEYNNITSPGTFYAMGDQAEASPKVDCGSYAVTVNGNFSQVDSHFVASSGQVVLDGDFVRTGGIFEHNSGTFVFNASDTDNVLDPNGATFNDVTFANTSTYSLDSDIDIDGALTFAGASGYTGIKVINIDPSLVAEDLTDYPLLVNMTDSDLRTMANGGSVTSAEAYDIVFTSEDGTAYDHEIEYYDPATGTVIAWVKVPNVSASLATTVHLRYGNDRITSSTEDPSGLWGVDYQGVWHMDDTSGLVADSTQNMNDGTVFAFTIGEVDRSASGQIGTGDEFTLESNPGNPGYILIGDNAGLDITGELTLSAWVYADALGGIRSIIAKGSTLTEINYSLAVQGTELSFGYVNGGQQQYVTSGAGLTTGQWYYVASTYNDSLDNASVFVNGARLVNSSATNPLVTNDGYLNISAYSVPAVSRYGWEGTLDEVRIQDVARSPGWVETEYNNQSSPGTFYSVTDQPSAVTTIHFNGGDMKLATDFSGDGADFTSGAGGALVLDGSVAQSFETFNLSFPGLKVLNASGTPISLDKDTTISGAIEIGPGAVLDLVDFDLDATGSTFSNDGKLRLEGSQTIIGLTMDSDSGEVEYYGDDLYTGLVAGNNYYDLTFTGGGTYQLTADLDVNNNLTLALDDWYDVNWSHRTKIAVDSAKVPETVEDFILYVDLSQFGPDFFDAVKSDGSDIVVTSFDGVTVLKRELVSIDKDAQTGELWFKADRISASADTSFYVYAGNVTADLSNDTDLWSGAYRGVWHLEDDENDSTSAARHLTNNGAGSAAGILGQGRDLENGSYLEDPDAGSYINGMKSFTLSLWAKSDVTGVDKGIVTCGDPDADGLEIHGIGLRYDAEGQDGGGSDVIRGSVGVLGYPDKSQVRIESADSAQSTSWQNLVLTWSRGEEAALYIDGAATAPTYNTPPRTTTLFGATKLLIGKGVLDTGGTDGWDGLVDEVKLLDTARSANWILTEFNNQSDPGTFFSADAQAGSIDIGTTGYNITIGGDLDTTAGGFSGSGTITFDDASRISNILGDTIFYNLTCSTAGKRLFFEAGSTQTIAGTLTIIGASGNPVYLASTSPGTPWYIDPQGSRSVNYVNVSDSVNVSGTVINATDSVDGGDNVDWNITP